MNTLRILGTIAFVLGCAQVEHVQATSWWTSITKGNQEIGTTDVKEDNNVVTVSIVVPDEVEPDNITMEIDGLKLRIRGEAETQNEVKKEGFYKKEETHVFFEKTVELPHLVNQFGTKAELKNGMLYITMPKIKETANLAKIKEEAKKSSFRIRVVKI